MSGSEARIEDASDIVGRFHSLYFERKQQTWANTFWLGVKVWKCPLDLWAYQELLFERRPDVVIETGTALGGSAHFLACVLDQIGAGRVITVDVMWRPNRPAHERITYINGSSIAPDTVAEVKSEITPGETVMVILDSDHSKDHVVQEMRAYGPLVAEGHYLVVEDSNVNGNPVSPGWGPGPQEAIKEFRADNHEFVVDRSPEKFLVTFNPGGFLKRVSGQPPE